MIKADRVRFFSVLTAISGTFGKQLSEDTVQVWWECFEEFSLEDFERALRHAAMTSEFLTIAVVRKSLRGPDLDPKDAATLAWKPFEQALRNPGGYRSVCFDDPIMHLASANCGDWARNCRGPEKELQYLRIRFEKAYAAGMRDVQRRGLALCAPEQILYGDITTQPPVLIGEPRKIALWHAEIGAPSLPQLAHFTDPKTPLIGGGQ